MITAIAYDGYVEVKIVATHYTEFEQDLRRFQKSIDAKDREYLSYKKVWKVKNLTQYTRVPFIQNALLDMKKQPSLFEEAR